jgi:hypothetical protein
MTNNNFLIAALVIIGLGLILGSARGASAAMALIAVGFALALIGAVADRISAKSRRKSAPAMGSIRRLEDEEAPPLQAG